jgi:hypothetical protein
VAYPINSSEYSSRLAIYEADGMDSWCTTSPSQEPVAGLAGARVP